MTKSAVNYVPSTVCQSIQRVTQVYCLFKLV